VLVDAWIDTRRSGMHFSCTLTLLYVRPSYGDKQDDDIVVALELVVVATLVCRVAIAPAGRRGKCSVPLCLLFCLLPLPFYGFVILPSSSIRVHGSCRAAAGSSRHSDRFPLLSTGEQTCLHQQLATQQV
jgi:hypothetical protein